MMTRLCQDCGTEYELPPKGYGQSKRCKACAQIALVASRARALRTPLGRYNSALHSAHRRRVPFEITFEAYAALISQPCYWCGNPLNPTGAGIDRLDDAEAYVLGNVVPSCWPCNNLRFIGDFTPDEMRRLGVLLGPIWQEHSHHFSLKQRRPTKSH